MTLGKYKIRRLWMGLALSISLLSACDKANDNANTDSPSDDTASNEISESSVEKVNTNDNPCLDQWVLDSIKDGIKQKSEEYISVNYGDVDTSLIYSADISFNYISKPTVGDNGDMSCSSMVTVDYLGNDDSKNDLVTTYAKLVNTDIPYSSNPFANAMTGYDTKEKLENIGVNKFNINQFSDLSGNTFSTQIEYDIKTTYTESGEAQQSYQAAINRPAAMLATISLLDQIIQRNEQRKAAASKGLKSNSNPTTEQPEAIDDSYQQQSDTNDLARSKQHLVDAYHALELQGRETPELIKEQKNWLKKRDRECGEDVSCLIEENEARASELNTRASDRPDLTSDDELPPAETDEDIEYSD